MRYRKKPVVIEAYQWDGTEDMLIHLNEWSKGKVFSFKVDLLVSTLEGVLKANIGDWIIKGVENEFYPCKSSVFEATYEKVDEAEVT